MRGETADSHCNISVESVLRLRPLAKRESEDYIVLEQVRSVLRDGPATVVLNPVHGPSLTSPVGGTRTRSESDATASNTPTEYHFNHVLPDSTSQDKIYYTLGLPVATAAMNTLKQASSGGRRASRDIKNHLLVCMGVTGSGKTYTCFGGSSVPKRRASQDGLVPRLIDSLFSQSKHHASSGNASKGFAVNISIVQVSHNKGNDPHACTIHDLLGGAPSPSNSKKKIPAKRNLTVRSMAAKFERVISSPIRSPMTTGSGEFTEMDTDNIGPSIESCADVAQAREILQKGLSNSVKAAKGQNHHLLITMQPVFNGNQFGDQISILDMAGLEKGKKVSSRGKDSVANKNQAASAAVLHCLRAMIHNTNVRTGKSNAFDIADDAMSEISSVSMDKDRMTQQLKPIPFRQHKVTMLLQPLFTSSSSTNVTLLLAAYPGHADYYEKKLLLQDMELLCGAALLASPRGGVDTGLGRSDSESYLTRESRTFSSSMDEDDFIADKAKGPFRARTAAVAPSTMPRPAQKFDYAGRTVNLSPSIDETEESDVHPPAYAPSYSKPAQEPRYKAMATSTAPTYKTAEPVVASIQPSRLTRNPPKNPDYVSDFPGTKLAGKRQAENPIVERQRVTGTVISASVGGRKAWAPSSGKDEAREESPITREAILDSSTDRERRYFSETKISRQPLGRSSLENERPSNQHETSEVPRSTKKPDSESDGVHAKRQSTTVQESEAVHHEDPKENSSYRATSKEATRLSHDGAVEKSNKNRLSRTTDGITRPGLHSRNQFESSTSITLTKSFDRHHNSEVQDRLKREAEERIQALEAKMKELAHEKEAYEARCSKLEKENRSLKESLKISASQNKDKWTPEDEEYFMKSRQARLEDQTLVKRPLRNHLDRVNYIYDIKNQWQKTDKQHFGLAFPSNFQRAPDLDLRDKAYEEKAAEAAARGQMYDQVEETKPHPSSPEPVTMAQRKGRNARKSTSPLAALKRIAMKSF